MSTRPKKQERLMMFKDINVINWELMGSMVDEISQVFGTTISDEQREKVLQMVEHRELHPQFIKHAMQILLNEMPDKTFKYPTPARIVKALKRTFPQDKNIGKRRGWTSYGQRCDKCKGAGMQFYKLDNYEYSRLCDCPTNTEEQIRTWQDLGYSATQPEPAQESNQNQNQYTSNENQNKWL